MSRLGCFCCVFLLCLSESAESCTKLIPPVRYRARLPSVQRGFSHTIKFINANVVERSPLYLQTIFSAYQNFGFLNFLRFSFLFKFCLTLTAELLLWRRRPSSVVRPSANSGFSETGAWIQVKFCGQLLIHYISRSLFFQFSNFYDF